MFIGWVIFRGKVYSELTLSLIRIELLLQIQTTVLGTWKCGLEEVFLRG